VRIADGDVTVPVTLVKLPEPERPTLYRLTVRADPPTAACAWWASGRPTSRGYTGAGQLCVEVSQSGYESKQVSVRIVDGDVTVPVALVKLPEPSLYR